VKVYPGEVGVSGRGAKGKQSKRVGSLAKGLETSLRGRDV